MPIILKDEWGLSSAEVGVMGGVIFAGFFAGTILGSLGDIVGRKIMFRIATFLITTGGLLSAFMPEIWSYLACRLICGCGIGIFEIIASAYSVEVTPSTTRGWYFVLLNFFYFLGAFYILGLGFALIPDLDPTYWRYAVGACMIPAAVSFVMSLCMLDESPRYSIGKKDYGEAVRIINRIASSNGAPEMTPHEKGMI